MGGVEGGVTLVRMYYIREKSVFNLKWKKKDLQKEEASTMTTYICKVELGLYLLNFIQKRIM